MALFLLGMMQPDGPPPAHIDFEAMGRELTALREEITAAGQWVFAGGLHDTSSSTVVRAQGGEVVITDGPYLEGKEILGGFTIVDVPDLDAAIAWAARSGAITGLPVEVRPFRW